MIVNALPKRILVCLAALLLALAVPAQGQEPTLEERIELADISGLAWLAEQQNPDGSWGEGCDNVAYTGLVVLKFETRAIELGLDPLDVTYEYSGVVATGLDYIVGHGYDIDISSEPPADSNGNGVGRLFNACPDVITHEVYNTSLSMMALAASGHPEIYQDLLQEAVDAMVFAQADEYCGVHRGGWRYACDRCDSDNSNSGYVTLALGYASSAPPYGFALTVPQFVRDELNIWIDTIQFRSPGDPDDGASMYAPPDWEWFNILKNGNLLYEMALVADTMSVERAQAALNYIERNWNAPGTGDVGWRDHCQAMFTMMKGFEAFDVETIEVGGFPLDWFEEVATHLLASQQPDGSWPWDPWGQPILSTAWALLTLERAVPQPVLNMPVDVKPGSCPNPFNLGAGGVLPVALVGTGDFDVTRIDPASIRINGTVAPLRWALEDVATPFEPFMEKEGALDCNALREDGFMDLTLKFSRRDIAALLTEAQDRDVMTLTVTAELQEEFGGTPCIGLDVIVAIE